MAAEYVIGIDLGTTNSVVAYTRLDAGETPQIQLLAIPQLTAPGTVESFPSLPSFMYLAADHEVREGAYDLPGAAGRDYVVGQWARQQSAEVPDRSVGGAKSWLAYSAVDRHTPILPWNAPDAVRKISPVTASQRYLEHLVDAWNQTFPDAPLQQQHVVLTVPASFDASARELTREAAAAAGLPAHCVLLEEPQAAVYAWLVDQADRWRKQLAMGDRLLVCDVGGGTTDLTLVDVSQQDGELSLQRLAVGNHLLVGGDNMDLALAHAVAQQFQQQGVSLDPWQAVSLWHACRTAKESLLAEDGSTVHKVSVLGRGSRLIGGTVSVELDRQRAADLLMEGFFPVCGLDERPARRRQSGFVQLGLPFETDTAITRHVAAFLGAHAAAGQPAARPSHVLFHGGVFRRPACGSGCSMCSTAGSPTSRCTI